MWSNETLAEMIGKGQITVEEANQLLKRDDFARKVADKIMSDPEVRKEYEEWSESVDKKNDELFNI